MFTWLAFAIAFTAPVLAIPAIWAGLSARHRAMRLCLVAAARLSLTIWCSGRSLCHFFG